MDIWSLRLIATRPLNRVANSLLDFPLYLDMVVGPKGHPAKQMRLRILPVFWALKRDMVTKHFYRMLKKKMTKMLPNHLSQPPKSLFPQLDNLLSFIDQGNIEIWKFKASNKNCSSFHSPPLHLQAPSDYSFFIVVGDTRGITFLFQDPFMFTAIG